MLERATLVSFDSGAWTATVRFAGSLSSVVTAVPVSRAISAAQLTAGRRLAVAVFDAGNPVDAMVLGVR